jgi:F-type H+-transporting ATPase subunit gamma
MAKARTLDKRRKSIRNIRKITRTMELIATARFKKAMDRAAAATAYTRRITQLVTDLARSGLEVSHPLLDARPEVKHAVLLVLTANRGLCGGYNSNVLRQAFPRLEELKAQASRVSLFVSGKRGQSAFKFRGITADRSYTHFEDKPSFAEVDVLAEYFLEEFIAGRLDRLDVAYMRFDSASRQTATVETLLPLGALSGADTPSKPTPSGGAAGGASALAAGAAAGTTQYEFLPSAESILEEVVPTSFKVRLFKCFLDAAVSEQIARMVAMKSATENADELIRHLSMTYNRARQTQITSELLDVLGGVEALKG